jgi:hypothetical protein
MQLLQPLAILRICFAAGYEFYMSGVDQLNFEAAPFHNLKKGNPVDTHGLTPVAL